MTSLIIDACTQIAATHARLIECAAQNCVAGGIEFGRLTLHGTTGSAMEAYLAVDGRRVYRAWIECEGYLFTVRGEWLSDSASAVHS